MRLTNTKVILLIAVVFCQLASFVQADYVLENDALKITFASSGAGFTCLAIENKLEGNTRFVEPAGAGLGWPGLWQMTFTNGSTVIYKSNGDSATKSAQWLDGGTTLVLKWDDMDLGADTDCLDVTATISLPAGNNPSTWTIDIVNTSTTWGVESSRYPILRTVCTAGTADVLLPKGAYGGTLKKNNTSIFADYYPSGSPYCVFQFVAFNKGDAGLYIAAHDGDANYKKLSVTTDQHFQFEVLAENPHSAGAATLPAISFVVQAYSGDWWKAAKIYREWGLQQKWASQGWLADRTNIPKNYMDIGYWVHENAWPDEWMADDIFVADMETMESTFDGLDLALHWYNWHLIEFDTDYPEFFPIMDQGVDDDIEKFQGDGATVMPYINVLLWDQGLASFPSDGPGLPACQGVAHGEDAAVKTPDGNYITWNAEQGHLWAPMCPYVPEWQCVMHDLCVRLIDPNELDVDGIYLDQLGGHRPDLCYDPCHGHPLGGGSHWTDGYRTMLDQITASVGSHAYLTGEMFAEPYIDYIHGFLIGHLYRHTEDVPLVQAVYSGYTNTFGNWQSKCDSVGSWSLIQGNSFVWGVTPGWNKPRLLLESGQESELALSVKMAKYRMAATEYLVYGELVGEVPITETTEITKNVHSFYDEACDPPIYSITSRTSIGSIWRTSDANELGIVVMNLDTQSRGATFTIDVDDYLDDTSNMGVFSITPTGITFVENLAGTGEISRALTLDAHEIVILAAIPYATVCGERGTVYLTADKNLDCYVNLADFALFASHWLWCTDPADSNCDQYWK